MITRWLIQRRDTAAGSWLEALHAAAETPTRRTKAREIRAQRTLHAWDTALTLIAAHRRS